MASGGTCSSPRRPFPVTGRDTGRDMSTPAADERRRMQPALFAAAECACAYRERYAAESRACLAAVIAALMEPSKEMLKAATHAADNIDRQVDSSGDIAARI